jgi:hypothetical protein
VGYYNLLSYGGTMISRGGLTFGGEREEGYSEEVRQRVDELKQVDPAELADEARVAHALGEEMEAGLGSIDRAKGYYAKAASLALLALIGQGERSEARIQAEAGLRAELQAGTATRARLFLDDTENIVPPQK